MLFSLLGPLAFVMGLNPPSIYHHVKDVEGWQILTNENDSDSCLMSAAWENGAIMYFGPSAKAKGTVLTLTQIGWTEKTTGAELADVTLRIRFDGRDQVWLLDGISHREGKTYLIGALIDDSKFLRAFRGATTMSVESNRGATTTVNLRDVDAAARAVEECETARASGAGRDRDSHQ